MINSLVITVFNEEKTIDRLLTSLEKQTKKPDEIIIVDGGSRDKTVEVIKKEAEKNKRLKLIIRRGATIAQGRNAGIKEAGGEIIAMADAGCVIHPDWFEKITKPFEDKKVDLVAGFYQMTGKSVFQKCLGLYLGIVPERLDPEGFIPSARSMAFRKKVWVELGGFNEKLDRGGEDTLFNYQAKRKGMKFKTVKEALVDWEVPNTWGEAIAKFYVYSKGDAQAGIWWHPSQRAATHSLKISAVYLRYLMGLLFLAFGFWFSFLWVILGTGFFAYLVWSVWKNYRFAKHWQAFFILPWLQVTSDLVVMIGFLIGSLKCVDGN